MDWNYIAGFFDGEGNLHTKPVKGGSGKIAYQLLIRIYSSDEKVLKEIQNYIKFGKIYLKKSTKVYELTITKKKESLEFLQKIKDLVIIKRVQIAFLLENYFFDRNNNLNFDIDKFRSFVTRRNVKRVHHNLV